MEQQNGKDHEIIKYQLREEIARVRDEMAEKRGIIHERIDRVENRITAVSNVQTLNEQRQVSFEDQVRDKLDTILRRMDKHDEDAVRNRRAYVPVAVSAIFSLATLVLLISRLV